MSEGGWAAGQVEEENSQHSLGDRVPPPTATPLSKLLANLISSSSEDASFEGT